MKTSSHRRTNLKTLGTPNRCVFIIPLLFQILHAEIMVIVIKVVFDTPDTAVINIAAEDIMVAPV